MTDPPNTTSSGYLAAEKNAEIAQRLRQGDRSAWEEMYDFYSRDLWRYVSRFLGEDQEIVAEVVQEVFLAAARNAQTYDINQGSLWAWLTGIAHHQTASWFRSQTRNRRILSEPVQQRLQTNQDNNSTASNPVMLLENAELRVSVRATLAELSAEYAMLLSAKYMDRLSVEEIQTQLGGTADSIRSKLKRARAEFRELFERGNAGGLD